MPFSGAQAADGDVKRIVGRDRDDAADELLRVESSAAAVAEVLTLAPEVRLELAFLSEAGAARRATSTRTSETSARMEYSLTRRAALRRAPRSRLRFGFARSPWLAAWISVRRRRVARPLCRQIRIGRHHVARRRCLLVQLRVQLRDSVGGFGLGLRRLDRNAFPACAPRPDEPPTPGGSTGSGAACRRGAAG